MNDISVIFITKNEEFHIGDAIDNVKGFAKDVFVVDSGSTDKTVSIAEAKGAKVLFHAFEGFGKQWNWALDNCPVATKWTMKMDPDERVSNELKSAIECAISRDDGINGYCFDRVLWFMERRLAGVKNEVLRVWKTGTCRFSDVLVNEHPHVEGRVGKLCGLMEHLDSVDMDHWLKKQESYAEKEALMRFRGDKLAAKPKLFGTSLERRMWLKNIFFKVPGRYLILKLILFFGKGAWRSGLNGWRWVKCREYVMRLRELKYEELMENNA